MYMKTRDWIYVLCAFIFTLLIDQATKIWSLNISEFFIGPLRFVLVKNSGAMLGSFSHLPSFLRVVILSTSGFFILSVYFFIQFIFPLKVLRLRIGFSILVAGILGNVVDRTLYGYVIDFIGLSIGQFQSPIWNLADMLQWVGYGIVSYSMYKDKNEIWPEHESRNIFWINKKFQIKFALIYIVSGLLLATICMAFSYTYLKTTFEDLGYGNALINDQYLTTFFFSYLVILFIFVLFLFSFSKYISHRIAGPLFSFERYIEELIQSNHSQNENSHLKLRMDDEFKNLELLADKIQNRLLELEKQNSQK